MRKPASAPPPRHRHLVLVDRQWAGHEVAGGGLGVLDIEGGYGTDRRRPRDPAAVWGGLEAVKKRNRLYGDR